MGRHTLDLELRIVAADGTDGVAWRCRRERRRTISFYILIFTKRSKRGVLPRSEGPPVAGYRSETTTLTIDTRRVFDARRPRTS